MLILAAGLVLGACADDDPTNVGADLLGEQAVRTFEVTVDAATLLRGDTALTGFTRPAETGLFVVARDFADTLDAHGLVRFEPFPTSVSYEDTAGSSQTDTDPTFIGGQVVVQMDSVRRNDAPGPVALRLLRISEPWDPATATWEMRADTGALEGPWDEPGGTTDIVLDSATWEPGTDSVTFEVDSLTIARWRDTTNTARGASLETTTAGTRLFASAVDLVLRARPSGRPDTVVTEAVDPRVTTTVFDPQPGATQALRVGGTPAWRSYLRFRDRIDTLAFAVPGADVDSVRLSDVDLNRAALVLEPIAPPAAFAPEDTVTIAVHEVFESDELPLARSPVGDALRGADVALAPSRFTGGGEPIEVPITSFLGARLDSGEDESTDDQPATTLALLASRGADARATFGFGAFGSSTMAGVEPKLRLILTVASEVEIR